MNLVAGCCPFFGYSVERSAERNDLSRYLDLLSVIMTELNTSNYEDAIALAKLAKGLRGFGYVRTKNRQQLVAEQDRLLAKFLGTAPNASIDAVAAA